MGRIVILIVEAIAVLLSLYWISTDTKIESIFAVFTSLAVLLGTFFLGKKKEKPTKKVFKQKAGKKSKQYMSGGKMNIKK